MNLASLLGDAQWKALTACVRSRQVGGATTTVASRFSELWTGDHTEAVCRFISLPTADTLRIYHQGFRVDERLYRQPDGQIVYRALDRLITSGASLNLAGVEDYSNTLLSLTRALESDLGCAVQANLYETPGPGRALGPHVDQHDVLVLQLRGQKCWTLDAPITVSAGDWLFVPKLIAHDVHNNGHETSVHLTLGFHPVTADGQWSHPDATRRTRVRAYQVAVPPGEWPSAAQIDDTSQFEWRTEAAAERRSATTMSVDVPYRRSPLTLRERAADALEQMTRMGTFRAADVTLDSAPDARLLCRFLVGVGCLRVA